MANCKNARLVDIARMAGVSVGTVDRVIHNRGRVSKENSDRIKEVLKRVDYHPNMIARSLASKRVYRIAVIIPHFQEGEYWECIDRGIDYAANSFEQYNLEVVKYGFDQFDESSCSRLLEEVMKELNAIDGVLLGTLFSDLISRFSKELDARSIPYVYVDSDLPNENRIAFVGTDSWAGGRMAARILLKNIKCGDDILVGHIVHSGADSTQVRKRQQGFDSYLDEAGYKGRIHYVDLYLEGNNVPVLDEVWEEHPKIQAAVIFNSKAYIVGEYLKSYGRKDVCLVGYDLIKRNACLLEEGYIEALMDQRPYMQGFIGIRLLCEYLVLEKQVKSVGFLPIDILIKENYLYRESYE